jgi:hypothetical protein
MRNLISTAFFLVAVFSTLYTSDPVGLPASAQMPTPLLVVAVPNGGEDWPVNSAQCIRWSTANFSFEARLRIELARDGTTFTAISGLDNVPNTGSACWRVTGATSQNCRLRITPIETGGPAADMSDAPFTISAARQSITVTAPSDNQMWTIGTDQLIRWQNADIVGDIRIELSRDGGLTYTEILFDRVPNIPNQENVKRWTVTGNEPRAARIRVTSLVNSFASGESGLFAIVPRGQSFGTRGSGLGVRGSGMSRARIPITTPESPTPNPEEQQNAATIRVDAPNIGERWTINSDRQIFWSTNNLTDLVKIELSTDAGRTFPIVIAENVTGVSRTWHIPTSVALLPTCRIRVSSMIDPSVFDVSDGDFVISLTAQPSITVTNPDGLEVYTAGSAQRMRWQFSGDVGPTIRIDISLDGGNTFQVLLDDVTNNTDKTWTVPNVTSTRCRIRIVSKRNLSVSDVSNCDFTIRSP